MNKQTFFSDFELEVQAAMAVPDAAPQFVSELRNQIVSEADKLVAPKTTRVSRRLAWGIPLTILLILTITTLVVGPQKVWAAVRSFFGYLPGVGYVQTDDSVFILDEPVQMEREDILVEVEQVVADSERTVVIYKAEGLSVQDANSQGESAPTGSIEFLRLTDGTELYPSSKSGPGWGIGYRSRLVFSSLPVGVDTVTLVIPRLQSMPAGVAPENWKIPLKLVPSEGEVTLLPVYEVEQPQDTGEQSPQEPSGSPAGEEQITFGIERVVELEDGFRLEGTVGWQGESDTVLEIFSDINVVDINGARVPSELVNPDELYASGAGNQLNWALHIVGKTYPGPWTITLPQLSMRVFPEIPFELDLGPTPQAGQTWPINHTFEVDGRSFSLNTVTLEQDVDQNYRLSFTFTSEEALLDVSLSDQTGGQIGGGGSGRLHSVTTFNLYDTVPTGVRQLVVGAVSFMQAGNWQITWQPPASAADTPQTQRPEATCLAAQSWHEMKATPAPPLPAKLGGRLLLLTHIGLNFPEISLTSLDGTQKQAYGIGAWVSLSPDGKTIAVPKDTDGIHLVDVESGEDTLIPNTIGGWYPVWSPDGGEIAFLVWDEATVYRIKLDGTGLMPVYRGEDIVYLSGWTSVGNKIMYLGFGDEGMAVRAAGVEDGLVETWVQTTSKKPVPRPNISFDGEWIIYIDKVKGDTVNGVYAAKIDGSEKKLLISDDGHDIGVGLGVWSPDGKWVALNVFDFTAGYENPVPVLINPTSCEVIPLFSLSGEVVGWSE